MVPSMTSCPPTQYTAAVPTAPDEPEGDEERAAVARRRGRRCARTPSARSANAAASSSVRPNSLTSSAPDTLKRSVIVVFIDALRSICVAGDRLQPAADPLGRAR